MIPSETIKEQDLILSLNRESYYKLFNELKLLKTGSPIQFNAIFEEIGDEWKPHHLHLLNLTLIDDFIADKEKVLLFKGINFDIEGHMKIEKEVNEVINDNQTEFNNEDKNDLNFTLDDESNIEQNQNVSINEKENNKNQTNINDNIEKKENNNTIKDNK